MPRASKTKTAVKPAAARATAKAKSATKMGVAVDAAPIHPDSPEAQRFLRGVVVRGEAAKPVKGAKATALPPGVTHEIVEEKDGAPSKIRRIRFSLL